MRLASKTQTADFIGPSLAAVGIGYIIPATVVKKVELTVFDNITDQEKESLEARMKAKGLSFVPETDRNYASFCLVALVAMMLVWLADIHLTNHRRDMYFLFAPFYIWVGAANMGVGIVLAEVKEQLVK